MTAVPKPTPTLKPSQRLRTRVRPVPKDVRQQVFERDNWHCRRCSARTGLDPHHLRRRSQGGRDEPSNLISLCRQCHRWVHDNPREARWRGFLLFTEDVPQAAETVQDDPE